MRGNEARQNPFEIRRFDLAPLNEVVRPVLDQDNPAKGRPQEYDKPSQQAQDRLKHRTIKSTGIGKST
jgi:hypothetical protein